MHAQPYYYLTRFVLKTCSCSPSVYNWFKCAKIAHPNVKISIYAYSQCFFTSNILRMCYNVPYVGKLISINFLLDHI